MSEELQQKLRSQLWTVANTLRGNMSASDFMYFTLGFIFYKYLSEKIELYANEILEEDHITFKEVWNGKDEELKQDVKEECIQNLGYFIEPEYLYSTIIELISKKENILPSLERSLKKIEDSTIGQDSEDDFGGLFSDLDLASPKLGKTADDKNKLISDVLTSFSSLGFSYSGLSGKSAQDFGSGKPFITYLNVYSNNIINEKDFQYVAIKEGEKQNVVEYGDVLFTLSSETPEEVGIGSVYLGNENVYLNSFCFGIHIINTKIAFPPYLSYYVSSTPFRKFIYPYAQGSTRFNLCKVDFEKASIKLPSLENQKRIYSILSHIESKTETEKSLLDLYNSQKQYLLRQMFI